MIRIEEDELHARYLGHNLNDCNQFEAWLKKLGLAHLIEEFSPYDFVNFGWIRPILRVDIPESHYLTWKNYPEPPAEDSEFPEEDQWASYCDPYSGPTLDDPPKSWFLHIFDKPDSEAKEFLSHKIEEHRDIPQNKEHPNGLAEYNPCWLYFSHWQGYLLVDLARNIVEFLVDLSKNIHLLLSVLNIPNAFERLQILQQKFPKLKESCDVRIEKIKKYWDKHATFFKYISYYRTFLGLSFYYTLNWESNERKELRDEGRRELANFLDISPEILETGIEKHLLTVFQEWQWARQRGKFIYSGALEQLQKDIYYAVEWLCFLKGEKFDTYFKKWKYHDRSQREWAELGKALPFEYTKTTAYFLELAPRYLTKISKNCPYMGKNQAISLINSLFQDYISFRRFCRAFHKLHDLLLVKNEIDFRDRDAFFDFFLILALRTEIVLLEVLERVSDSGEQENKSLNLEDIFKKFKEIIPNKFSSLIIGLDLAFNNRKKCVNLRDKPSNPFEKIEKVIEEFPCKDTLAKQFAISFLTSAMCRNYFAHHYYLDSLFAKKKFARKGLEAMLTTLLYLSFAVRDKQV